MPTGSHTVQNDFATFLRNLRTSRQISLTRLATQAGIGKSTLSRWESGQFQPRLSELEAVIRALDVPPGERERALALVDAPRAVAQLRRESGARQSAVSGDGWHGSEAVGDAPCTGDLLRALRLRRRLPLEVVAARLGVQARTVRRWEASQSVLPGERLEALCALLGIQPEERAALTNHLLLGAAAPASDTEAQAREACASEVATLAAGTERGEHRLMDLRFLLLEARLYQLATADPLARRLLAEAYAWHGQWLSLRGRIREAGPLAQRALDLVTAQRQASPEPFWLRAVHVSAVYDRDVRHAPPAHQVEFYRHWLPAATRPEDESRLWRDMANAASMNGWHIDAALNFIVRGNEAAQRSGDVTTILLAHSVHASVLDRAGRPGDALRQLWSACVPVVPFSHAFDLAVRWARLLLATGDRADAQAWLARAYQIADDYDLLPEAADHLAQRF